MVDALRGVVGTAEAHRAPENDDRFSLQCHWLGDWLVERLDAVAETLELL